MTDKIGRLARATVAAQGTTVAYTVPANKTARVKLMHRGIAGVNSTLAVLINGVQILLTAALTSGNASYTSSALMHNTGTVASVNGGSDATTIAPGPKEYFLAGGDTISYTIGTADFSSMFFDVVGAELDV
jgi:hypothetical protein